MPGDDAAGKASCDGSVVNGDCGISDVTVGSAEPAAVRLDVKPEIPRRSSIIKVSGSAAGEHLHEAEAGAGLILLWGMDGWRLCR